MAMAMADARMMLATAGLFAAKWTTRIEAEWIRSLEENRPDLQDRLDYRREQMREAAPGLGSRRAGLDDLRTLP